jgi:hypothetical protein
MAVPYSALSAAGINATNVRSGFGYLIGWSIANTTNVARYVRLYDKASAPVPASDVPFFRLVIPPSDGKSEMVFSSSPIWLARGLAYDITAASPDTDTTAVSAGDVIVNLLFQ